MDGVLIEIMNFSSGGEILEGINKKRFGYLQYFIIIRWRENEYRAYKSFFGSCTKRIN